MLGRLQCFCNPGTDDRSHIIKKTCLLLLFLEFKLTDIVNIKGIVLFNKVYSCYFECLLKTCHQFYFILMKVGETGD